MAESDVEAAILDAAGPGPFRRLVDLGGATGHLERRYGNVGRAVVRIRAVENALGLLEEAVR